MHPIVREGLARAIAEAGDLVIVGQIGAAAAALVLGPGPRPPSLVDAMAEPED